MVASELGTIDKQSRRRFLGLAAAAGATVIGVDFFVGATAAAAAPAPPESESEEIESSREDPVEAIAYDDETGFPIFPQDYLPDGYVRSALPCAPTEYIDVPVPDVDMKSVEPMMVVAPPYSLAGAEKSDGFTHDKGSN